MIEKVTIATTGNANDFGDLIDGENYKVDLVSDSHGGLDKYVRSISICQINHR